MGTKASVGLEPMWFQRLEAGDRPLAETRVGPLC